MGNIDFSVVVPVYNSNDSLPILTERLIAIFSKMNKSYEIIFINDCSKDNSYQVLQKVHTENEHIIVVDLFRNYGQQNAIMCGFNHSSGDYIITMDDDLQNSPDDIPVLFNKIQEGFDVVIGKYADKKHGFVKNLGSRTILALNRYIFKIKDMNLRFTSFRMIRKEIIDQLKYERTNFPYISGMLVMTTNKITNVEIHHYERPYGKSSYNISMLFNLAFNLVLNYSSIPIKIIGYLGLFASLFSMVFGLFILIRKYLEGGAPPGWTTLIVLFSFYNALNYIFFFFLGEYVSRILQEVSNKKQYVVREVLK